MFQWWFISLKQKAYNINSVATGAGPS